MIARLGAQCDGSATTHNLISFQLMSLSLINNPNPSLPWTISVSRSYSNPSLAPCLASVLPCQILPWRGLWKNRGPDPSHRHPTSFFGENGNGRWSRHQRQLFLSLHLARGGRETELEKALYLQQRLPVPSLDDDDSIILFNLDSFLFSFSVVFS